MGGGDVDCCDGVTAFEKGAGAEDASAAAKFENVDIIGVVGCREVGKEFVEEGVSWGTARGGMFEGKSEVGGRSVVVASFDEGSSVGGVRIGHDGQNSDSTCIFGWAGGILSKCFAHLPLPKDDRSL